MSHTRNKNQENENEKRIQQRYCSCVMKVRPKFMQQQDQQAPYAICTKSVLWKHGVKAPASCINLIDMKSFTNEQVVAYAWELSQRRSRPKKKLSSPAKKAQKKKPL